MLPRQVPGARPCPVGEGAAATRPVPRSWVAAKCAEAFSHSASSAVAWGWWRSASRTGLPCEGSSSRARTCDSIASRRLGASLAGPAALLEFCVDVAECVGLREGGHEVLGRSPRHPGRRQRLAEHVASDSLGSADQVCGLDHAGSLSPFSGRLCGTTGGAIWSDDGTFTRLPSTTSATCEEARAANPCLRAARRAQPAPPHPRRGAPARALR